MEWSPFYGFSAGDSRTFKGRARDHTPARAATSNSDMRQWRVPDKQPTADRGRVRFGLFEFDPATGELRREGALLRLQPQPSAVLAYLVARPGEVVTREALRDAVWGGDTFVDFDRGLNFCVA